jgi:hypothetical protein
MNAKHAADNAASPSRRRSTAAQNSAAAAAAIRAFTDGSAGLAATNSLIADALLTCQHMLEDHAVQPGYHHLAKIRAAVKAPGRTPRRPPPLPRDGDAGSGRRQDPPAGHVASGDFAVIGTTLQIVGEMICEAVDLRAGERVLDVAAGNGNATLAAAAASPT